ncbi:hypothetical protein ACFU51_04895 [Streptomyces sp. NPDC057430]|uniref:hypothetical protein n=1 Tax=unclassified Streptomyces TaxID=2593676 RepID=UPI0036823FFF
MTTMVHDPLHDPQASGDWVPPVDVARQLAREALDRQATANIHDEHAMLQAATVLHYVLRDLLNALDAEDGGR